MHTLKTKACGHDRAPGSPNSTEAGSSPPSNTPGPPSRTSHPDVPDVVIVTGAGSNQKGTPEGYQLRGHHWPERWVLGGQDQPRAPELFIAGELLAAGGRAVVEVMLHEAAHALATRRGIKDTSAAGNRYHNKRFVALAAELGLRGPGRAGQDHRLVALHAARAGRLRRLGRRDRRDRRGPAPVPDRPGPPGPPRRRGRYRTAARTRATTARASPPSGAGGGSRSSAPASPSRAASSSRPSRSRTARSCAACAAPRSNCPGTTRVRNDSASAFLPGTRSRPVGMHTPTDSFILFVSYHAIHFIAIGNETK